MESMRRQLSTSLPQQRNEPDLLSEFKAAALSVTNLYKTAATAQKHARTAGYQDALEELLAFLDKENLGMGDGEGWKVRQWATERFEFEGILPRNVSTDEEDSNATSKDEERTDYNQSPEPQRKPSSNLKSNGDVVENGQTRQRRVASEPPQQQNKAVGQSEEPVMQSQFTFRSNRAYPSNNSGKDNGGTDMDIDKSNTNATIFTNIATTNTPETIRILPRTSKGSRLSSHNRRNDGRGTGSAFNLGAGAGNKRRLPYPDFFDISGVPDNADWKDSNGQHLGKRGRHT